MPFLNQAYHHENVNQCRLKKLSEYELQSSGQDNASERKRPRIIADDVIIGTSTQRDNELRHQVQMRMNNQHTRDTAVQVDVYIQANNIAEGKQI